PVRVATNAARAPQWPNARPRWAASAPRRVVTSRAKAASRPASRPAHRASAAASRKGRSRVVAESFQRRKKKPDLGNPVGLFHGWTAVRPPPSGRYQKVLETARVTLLSQ